MPNISVADYEEIAKQANVIRTQGEEVNAQMISAYNEVTNMHNSWYGIRYNKLVQGFNEMNPLIREMTTLVVGEIPFALETIANNYSQVDSGSNVTSANNTAPEKISDIPVSNDVGMRFITGEVEAIKKSVINYFKQATDKMNEIEGTYGSITWESEAAASFKERFTKLKGEIVNSFQEIEKNFTELMAQALADMEAAENANTVK